MAHIVIHSFAALFVLIECESECICVKKICKKSLLTLTVASDTRVPGFESSHRRQLLLNIYLLLTVCSKDENKEKEAGNGPFLKKTLTSLLVHQIKKSFNLQKQFSEVFKTKGI